MSSEENAAAQADRGVDWYLIGALACGLIVALVQLVMIGGPLSGYHGYNESF